MYFSTAFKGVLTCLNAIKREFLKYFKILLKYIKIPGLCKRLKTGLKQFVNTL